MNKNIRIKGDSHTKRDSHLLFENDLGLQPIAGLMTEHGVKPHDLVRNSSEQLTHKMVSRAVKGKRLTPNIQHKIMRALSKAMGKSYELKDLFNY